MTEKKREIRIDSLDPDTEQLLGFFHFKWDKDGYCVKGIKMANFNATLPYHALATGATSKAAGSGHTGQHGESLKLSALVFRRNNFNYLIESGSFK
jgi:hypothetical protein